jgi:hypothetical protein
MEGRGGRHLWRRRGGSGRVGTTENGEEDGGRARLTGGNSRSRMSPSGRGRSWSNTGDLAWGFRWNTAAVGSGGDDLKTGDKRIGERSSTDELRGCERLQRVPAAACCG